MARARTNTRRKTEERDRRPKKKISILDQERVDWIDYKDVNLLRRFMSERAKIRARRVTGNNAQQQREVARAIRVAREMALLPYSVRQVTQRSRSGRRDRGDRADLSAPMPTPDAPPPVVSELDELPEGVTVEVLEETVGAAVAAPETGGEEAATPEADATDSGAGE